MSMHMRMYSYTFIRHTDEYREAPMYGVIYMCTYNVIFIPSLRDRGGLTSWGIGEIISEKVVDHLQFVSCNLTTV